MLRRDISKMRDLRAVALIALLLLTAAATRPAQAQTFSLLHTFTSVPDGANPAAALIRDAHGNLFGTTEWGGVICNAQFGYTCGTVFKVDSAGKETVLYRFLGGADGANPVAALV